MNSTTTPRIYVASLSDYNAGTLHGVWIDATDGKEQVWAQIHAMLAESEEDIAEEWAIHDFEGFGTLRLSEYSSIDDVCELAELIEEHGVVFAELVSHFGELPGGLEEAKTAFCENYCGEFSSLTDYAEHFVDECHSDALKLLPEFIRYHIDYEGIGRDLEMGGDVFTVEVEHRVHVFWSR